MSYRYIANDYLSPVSAKEILVTNRSFLYGEGAFTTILRQKNRAILWDEHREKLIKSWLQFYPKANIATLRNRLNQNILKISDHSQNECLKIHLFCNDEVRGMKRKSDSMNPNILVFTSEFENQDSTSLVTLKTNDRFKGDFKRPSYLNEIKETQTPLYVQANGRVLESSVSNIFFVKGNQLLTPKISKEIYPGLVREFIVKNYYVVERDIFVDELKNFESAFLTNSLQVTTNVSQIDEYEFKASDIALEIRNKICQ